jgi:hypothetical protein
VVLGDGRLRLTLVLESQAARGDEKRCVPLLNLPVVRGRSETIDEVLSSGLIASDEGGNIPEECGKDGVLLAVAHG